MAKKRIPLSPNTDLFEAMGRFLTHRISGAPVVDEKGKLVGVLSEKDCMKILVDGVSTPVIVIGNRRFCTSHTRGVCHGSPSRSSSGTAPSTEAQPSAHTTHANEKAPRVGRLTLPSRPLALAAAPRR